MELRLEVIDPQVVETFDEIVETNRSKIVPKPIDKLPVERDAEMRGFYDLVRDIQKRV